MNNPSDIQCAIIVSSNREISAASWAKEYQRKYGIVDLPRYWIVKNGKKIVLSYMKMGEIVVFSPLFPKEGRKQIRMTLKEYNHMISTCPVISDDIFPVAPEVVRAVEEDSRIHHKYPIT